MIGVLRFKPLECLLGLIQVSLLGCQISLGQRRLNQHLAAVEVQRLQELARRQRLSLKPSQIVQGQVKISTRRQFAQERFGRLRTRNAPH